MNPESPELPGCAFHPSALPGADLPAPAGAAPAGKIPGGIHPPVPPGPDSAPEDSPRGPRALVPGTIPVPARDTAGQSLSPVGDCPALDPPGAARPSAAAPGGGTGLSGQAARDAWRRAQAEHAKGLRNRRAKAKQGQAYTPGMNRRRLP